PGLARPAHDAIIQRPVKKVRKNRQYLELHSGLPNMGMLTFPCVELQPRAPRPLPSSGAASRHRSAETATPASLPAIASRSAAARSQWTSQTLPRRAAETPAR